MEILIGKKRMWVKPLKKNSFQVFKTTTSLTNDEVVVVSKYSVR